MFQVALLIGSSVCTTGYAADWWSVGIILFELITGVPPFNADHPEVFVKVLNTKIIYLLWFCIKSAIYNISCSNNQFVNKCNNKILSPVLSWTHGAQL